MPNRYLKKFRLPKLDVRAPLLTQLRDPEDLHHFFQKLQSSEITKVIAVALDHDHLHLRNEVLAYGLNTLSTPLLFQFVLLSTGKKFIVVLNHPKGNSSPTQADKALMVRLQRVHANSALISLTT